MRLRYLVTVAVVAGAFGACDAYTGANRGFGLVEPPPPPPTQLAFTVHPSDVSAQSPITPAIQVAIQTATGTLSDTSTNVVTLSITPGTGTLGAVLAGTRIATAVAGVATFPGVSVDRAGAGFTLTATAGSLTAAASNPFTVSP